MLPRISSHYDRLAKSGAGKRKRSASLAFGVRRFNNAVKRELLARHAPPGGVLLDLASGRGGDLDKWRASLGPGGAVYACDISEESQAEAARRYEDARKRHGPALVPRCQFSVGDAADGACLSRVAPPPVRFDLVTCHFAAHYMWETAARADAFLGNVAAQLRAGGKFLCTTVDEQVVRSRAAAEGEAFGNALYKIRMHGGGSSSSSSYEFSLVDCVDRCTEWLVPRGAFVALASRHNLALDGRGPVPFLQFLPHDAGSLTQTEREVVSLYCVYVFVKVP